MGRECGACVSHTLGLGPPRAIFIWQLSLPVASTVAMRNVCLTSIHAIQSLATNARSGAGRRARGRDIHRPMRPFNTMAMSMLLRRLDVPVTGSHAGAKTREAADDGTMPRTDDPARSQRETDRWPPLPPACVTGAGRRRLLAAAAVGAKMTPAQITEAQRLAREWKPTSPALKHGTSRRAREAVPA